jgi:hypothetical protein
MDAATNTVLTQDQSLQKQACVRCAELASAQLHDVKSGGDRQCQHMLHASAIVNRSSTCTAGH